MGSIDLIVFHGFVIIDGRLFAFYTTYTDLVILMYIYD